jgi:hypothetical protein
MLRGLLNSSLGPQASRLTSPTGNGSLRAAVGAEQAAAVRPVEDKLEISTAARGGESVSAVRAQFELNVQSLREVRALEGKETRAFSFSVEAGVEIAQIGGGASADELLESAEEALGALADGLSQALASFAEGAPAPDAGAAAVAEQNALATELQQAFSPENTANRILDFALGGFGQTSFGQQGNTPEARAGFADFIGGAIQRGFEEAKEILGELPDEVQAGVDETFSRIQEGLADFAENGFPEGRDGAIAEARSIEIQLDVQIRTEQVRQSNYDASGRRFAQSPQSSFAISG